MQFPNEIQAALLFDRPVDCLDAIVRDFARIEEARSGARFNVPEARPGFFYRLFGGDELMITLEYLAQPADVGFFQQALGSAVTGILCPDIRERLTLSRSHILINVSHGAMGDVLNSPEIARMLQQINYATPGSSLPQFMRRLDVCALIARMTCDQAPAQAVHWCQSNQIFPGEAFDAVAACPPPGHLHVHPYLFGGEQAECGETKLGIRTFGARHFIGREILIQPNVIPWAANFDTILAFIRIATTQNGYVIPDGDTFGPEDRSLSYRVLHRDAEDGDVPIYELVPLMHREFNFQADDFVPQTHAINDRSPPAELMPEDDEAKMELANEWREKRKLAEGLGGRFEVRHRDAGPGVPPAGGSPTPGGFGGRPVFGRKRA
jgi:hypothetical protein